MDSNLIWLQGALTAQGYLLELLLGARLLEAGDPLANLAQARTALDKQLRFDMHVPHTDTPHADLTEIQGAALKHLHELLDRVQTQLTARPATSGGARE